MTISDLRAKLDLNNNALKHATIFANENPSSREARAIEKTLLLRKRVLTHEIAKQEGLASTLQVK